MSINRTHTYNSNIVVKYTGMPYVWETVRRWSSWRRNLPKTTLSQSIQVCHMFGKQSGGEAADTKTYLKQHCHKVYRYVTCL